MQSNSNSAQDKKPKHSASRHKDGQLYNSKKSLAVFLIQSSNYNFKSLAASQLGTPSDYNNKCQFLTSVDCWVNFYRSPTSCFSHHSQRPFQVDWCIGLGRSNCCSFNVWRRVHLRCKQIKSWGSMGSSNLLSNFQVDCYLFQNIPSLPQRLRNILWGRMRATAATQRTRRVGALVATWWTQQAYQAKRSRPRGPQQAHQAHQPCWLQWHHRAFQAQWPSQPCWHCWSHWRHWPRWPWCHRQNQQPH